MPDGQPQATVVWATYDGEYIMFNTARGRQKERNLRERPQATVLVVDPENPYRYLEVRGRAEITEEGAMEHIDVLAQQYAGVDSYYGNIAPAEDREKETRVICKIKPMHVNTRG